MFPEFCLSPVLLPCLIVPDAFPVPFSEVLANVVHPPGLVDAPTLPGPNFLEWSLPHQSLVQLTPLQTVVPCLNPSLAQPSLRPLPLLPHCPKDLWPRPTISSRACLKSTPPRSNTEPRTPKKQTQVSSKLGGAQLKDHKTEKHSFKRIYSVKRDVSPKTTLKI